MADYNNEYNDIQKYEQIIDMKNVVRWALTYEGTKTIFMYMQYIYKATTPPFFVVSKRKHINCITLLIQRSHSCIYLLILANFGRSDKKIISIQITWNTKIRPFRWKKMRWPSLCYIVDYDQRNRRSKFLFFS